MDVGERMVETCPREPMGWKMPGNLPPLGAGESTAPGLALADAVCLAPSDALATALEPPTHKGGWRPDPWLGADPLNTSPVILSAM